MFPGSYCLCASAIRYIINASLKIFLEFSTSHLPFSRPVSIVKMQTSIVSARATEPTKIPTTTMLRGICLEDAESLRRVREGLKYYMIHVTIKPWAPELAVLSEEERMVVRAIQIRCYYSCRSCKPHEIFKVQEQFANDTQVNGIFGAVRLNKDRFPLLLNAVANFAESGKRKGETVQEAAKSIAELGDILVSPNLSPWRRELCLLFYVV